MINENSQKVQAKEPEKTVTQSDILVDRIKDLNVRSVWFMINKGVDVNKENQNGVTPLYAACCAFIQHCCFDENMDCPYSRNELREKTKISKEIIKMLIVYGADIHQKQSFGIKQSAAQAFTWPLGDYLKYCESLPKTRDSIDFSVLSSDVKTEFFNQVEHDYKSALGRDDRRAAKDAGRILSALQGMKVHTIAD